MLLLKKLQRAFLKLLESLKNTESTVLNQFSNHDFFPSFQICPASPPSLNKELIRELKMSDFLDKAVCLQLFCSGEKLNVRASKVSLVRYNDNVRNLLGVQTIRMNL